MSRWNERKNILLLIFSAKTYMTNKNPIINQYFVMNSVIKKYHGGRLNEMRELKKYYSNPE